MFITKQENIEFYTIENIEIIQKQMYDILLEVDEICKNNGITYFLDGGTAIGALRHQGFIPWDDDLDISMLKPDYLRLINILKNLDKRNYFLFDYKLDAHGCSFFGIKNDIFGSSNKYKWSVYPIKIDIRPINLIKDTEEERKINVLYRELANKLLFNKYDVEYDTEIMEIYEKFDNDKNKFFYFYNWEYGLYEGEDALLAHPYLEYSTFTYFNRTDFLPVKYAVFEGKEFPIPGKNTLLEEVYSSFMELPSVEARKPEAYALRTCKKNKLLYDILVKREKNIIDKGIQFILAELLVR